VSLRQQAAADLLGIVEDADGFGWPITVTNPIGTTLAMIGLSTDIGQTIDPETGQAVAGRRASVALSIARLEAAGMGIPRNIAEKASKPWVITFADISGASHTYKVATAMPDIAIGCVTCMLESYKP
jgi:hypothetical protein